MSHYAQLDENNIVTNVIVIADEDSQDSEGNETEEAGVQFCKSLFGEDTIWKKTSYNTTRGVHELGGTPYRDNYARIGCTYDEDADVFIEPSPYPSWVLNTNGHYYEAPTPMPEEGDGVFYRWDEDTTSWVQVTVDNYD